MSIISSASSANLETIKNSELRIRMFLLCYPFDKAYCLIRFHQILRNGVEPYSRLAAVLVLLFERDGALRVLVTTRGENLKTHGGQTSLPGGKMDAEDNRDVFTTAVSSQIPKKYYLYEQFLLSKVQGS